jgi:hypothetical protein
MEKDPYDSSTEKAKLLKIEDFGTPDEVKEMASPIRSAHNRANCHRTLVRSSPFMGDFLQYRENRAGFGRH